MRDGLLLCGMWMAGNCFGISGLEGPATILIGASALGWTCKTGALVWEILRPSEAQEEGA